MDRRVTNGAILSEEKSVLWRISNYVDLWAPDREQMNNDFEYRFTVSGVSGGVLAPLVWACRLSKRHRNEKKLDGFLILETIPDALSKSHVRIDVQVAEKKMMDGIIVNFAKLLHPDPVETFWFELPPPSEQPKLTTDGALEVRIKISIYHPEAQNAKLAALKAQLKDRFRQGFGTQSILSRSRKHHRKMSRWKSKVGNK